MAPRRREFFEANVVWYTLVMAFANFNQKTNGRYFEHIFIMTYNNWGEVDADFQLDSRK